MDQMKDHHEKEEVDDPYPAEETKDTAQTDFDHPPSESDFMNEMKYFLDVKEVVDLHPADEPKDTAQTDFFGIQYPSKSEARPAVKKNKTSQIDSAVNLQHPSKSDFMNEKKNSHDKQEVDEPHTIDKTKDRSQKDSAVDHQQPSESNFMHQMKDLHEKEEVDEPHPAEETKDKAQTDFAFDYQQPSETDLLNEKKDILDNEEMDETDPICCTSGFKNGQGKVYFMTKKSPFSIHVEIDDFLHDPICGDIVQNKFEFLDLYNKQTPEFDTKLINTTAYYPEQPDCRLVCSKINEFVFLTYDQNEGKNNKGNHYKSIAVPMHGSLFTEAEESNNNSYMHIRVPVVLGEYKIEISLEENVTFKEEVKGIKGVSKEVVISNFRLVPTVLSQSLNNGTRTVLKGILFIEGYIDQKIEYTAFPNKITESLSPLNQLNQKMAVELMIHILQVQQVRVKR
jgi:hypothetical protein